jgi:hypothetical protein
MEQHPKERILLTQPTTGPVSDTGLQYANACHNKWGIDSVTKSGSPLAARGESTMDRAHRACEARSRREEEAMRGHR